MEKFYDVIESKEGRESVVSYIDRVYALKARKFADPINKAKAEILVGEIFFTNDNGIPYIDNYFIKSYLALTEEEKRKVDMTIRDLVDHYKVIDLIKAESIDKESDDLTPIINKILDDYMEFRTSLDTVTPEDSEEIEKILEMSDEEYDAYQKAKDDELEAQFEKASKGDTGDISGDEESN